MTSPPDPARPILVSACLAGVRCRHDGAAKPNERVIDLVRRGLAIPVCPEQLGGLPTPREPASPTAGPDPRVVTDAGRDVTDQFQRGAAEALRIAQLAGVRRAILKERSPSCGTHEVWQIAPGETEPRLVPGEGVTARTLRAHGIAVENEAGD